MKKFFDDHNGRATELHKSSCAKTGEIYVRPITGRFRGMSNSQLLKIIAGIKMTIFKAGGMVGTDETQPLWQQAEYLDNIMDFELNPPCGCPSKLRKKIKAA